MQRKEKLEAWLRRIDQRDAQAARQRRREPETGQWFFEGQLFRDWLNGDHSFLWLNGDVGCGKTILCSSIVEKLQGTVDHLYTTAYFYFSWDNADSHDLGIVLRCILAQLTSDSRFLARLEALKEEGERRVLNRDDMYKALLEALCGIPLEYAVEHSDNSYKTAPVVLIFDALDEIPFGGPRDAIIDLLNSLATVQPVCLRIIVTSRRDFDIEERLVTSGGWKSQQIDPKHVDHDIGLFVNGQMSKHPRMKLQSDKVKRMVSEGIVGMANGM